MDLLYCGRLDFTCLNDHYVDVPRSFFHFRRVVVIHDGDFTSHTLTNKGYLLASMVP